MTEVISNIIVDTLRCVIMLNSKENFNNANRLAKLSAIESLNELIKDENCDRLLVQSCINFIVNSCHEDVHNKH